MSSERRPGDVYGISGFYKNLDFQDIIFGGYFITSSLDEVEDEDELGLNGKVIDRIGPAIIQGRITSETIIFDKKYESMSALYLPSDEIGYNLTQTEDGYRGVYRISDRYGLDTGPVFAKVTQLSKGLPE